jgi:hypothetical protein
LFDPEMLRGLPLSDWIALSNDETRVVAHGPDLAAVIEEAKSMGESRPIITGVPVRMDLIAIFHG